jgi:cytochrome c5
MFVMKFKIWIPCLVVIFSCGSAKLLVPTQADVDTIRPSMPAVTLAELQKGQSDFEKNCGNCHGLKNPLKKTEEQWKKTVPRMAEKAKKKFGKETIDQATQESILKYLIAMRTSRAGS